MARNIEKMVLNYLDNASDYGVYMQEPSTPPSKYVLISKTGSSNANHITTATVVIYSMADSLYEASNLNYEVIEKMLGFAEDDNVARCKLENDYYWPNTKSKHYRYKATFNITYY